jgi:hypothetical protein
MKAILLCRPGGARICRGADPGSRRGQGAGQGRHNRRQHAGIELQRLEADRPKKIEIRAA